MIHRGITDDALARLNIDKMGLDRTDHHILETIILKFDGGPVGLDTLAAAVSEETETIEDMYEPYLMQQGFLQRTPRGRIASRLAYETLGLAWQDKSKNEPSKLFEDEE